VAVQKHFIVVDAAFVVAVTEYDDVPLQLGKWFGL
jgi:hypothetical protein